MRQRSHGGRAASRMALPRRGGAAWRGRACRQRRTAGQEAGSGRVPTVCHINNLNSNHDLSCDQNSGRGLACAGRARPVRWRSSACSPRSLPLLQLASGRPAPKYAAVWNAAVLGAISAHHLLFILDSEGYLRTNRTSSPRGSARWSTPSAGRSYMAPRRPIQRLMLSWLLQFTA